MRHCGEGCARTVTGACSPCKAPLRVVQFMRPEGPLWWTPGADVIDCMRSALALCLKAGTPPSSRKKDINELHAQLPSVELPAAAK